MAEVTSPPPLLSWPAAPESDDINQYGYVVWRQHLQPSTMLVRRARRLASAAPPIFGATLERNDGKRRQRSIVFTERQMPGVDAMFRHEPLLRDVRRSGFVAIYSAPGCAAQAPHTDVPPSPTARRSLGVLVALENGTTLDVWPASCHLVYARNRIGEMAPRAISAAAAASGVALPIPRHALHLRAGDVVVFRGDLVHAGSAYGARSNVRLHCYCDAPDVPRPRNKTWVQTNPAYIGNQNVVDGDGEDDAAAATT